MTRKNWNRRHFIHLKHFSPVFRYKSTIKIKHLIMLYNNLISFKQKIIQNKKYTDGLKDIITAKKL